HREHRDVGGLSGVRGGPVGGEVQELVVGLVIRVDLGLVAGAVGDGADGAHGRVAEVVDEPPKPERRDERVVVEQDQYIALDEGESLVVGGGEAPVVAVADGPYGRASVGQVAEEGGGAVGGAVVHDDHLVAC